MVDLLPLPQTSLPSRLQLEEKVVSDHVNYTLTLCAPRTEMRIGLLVLNNPISHIDPLGLYGAGVVVSGQAGAGAAAGTAGQVSGGGGSFYNQNTGGTTLGGYVSNGGFSGGPNATQGAAGISASLGGGFFFTNAKDACELKGPFQQYDINLPLISFSFASSGNTWIVTVTAGPSTPTSSYTAYTTTTTGTAQTPAF